MRRGLAEWLVLPLFLLPILAGAAFVLYARSDYERRTGPYRDRGSGALQEWFHSNPDRAEELRREFLLLCGPGGPASGDSDSLVPFRLDDARGRVRLGASSPLGREPWTVTRDYPAGLTPAALSNPTVRFDLQRGLAPSADALDEAAVALRELALRPDRSGLRRAPLPASTKLHLLRSWPPDDPWRNAAARLLVALRDLSRSGGVPDRPGVHRIGRARLVSSAGAWPDLLLPEGEPLERVSLSRGVSEVVRLTFTSRATEDGGPPAAPVAGEWVFDLPYGDAWWRAPLLTRWVALAGAGILALFLLPAAILVSLRRRRRLDEAKSRFLNELAHDLRTPLTSLRLYSEMLAGNRVPEEERGRYVEVLARESTRVSGLLGNLLDLSRLETGGRTLEPERIDLDEAMEPLLADFAAVHPDRAEDLRVGGPDGAWVRADRTAFARVLANLLDNAGKFTPAGTPIRLSWEPVEGARVAVRVADEGPGIADSERRRVFRRYARGRTATDGIPGTGMGLSLVRELTVAMGGSVRLARVTRGATFEVRLPGGVDG
jgi:signal transduction histidine kinase